MSVFVILWSHWLADVVLQAPEMRSTKAKHLGWLLLHTGIYTAVLFAAVLLSAVLIDSLRAGAYVAMPNARLIMLWALFNGAVHGLVDSVCAPLAERYWDQRRRRMYVVTIGFDQILHLTLLLLTFPLD